MISATIHHIMASLRQLRNIMTKKKGRYNRLISKCGKWLSIRASLKLSKLVRKLLITLRSPSGLDPNIKFVMCYLISSNSLIVLGIFPNFKCFSSPSSSEDSSKIGKSSSSFF